MKKLSGRFLVTTYSFLPKLHRLLSVLPSGKVLEERWAPVVRRWDSERAQQWNASTIHERSYVLSMFPYPSGALHLGHLRVYTVGDVLYRYQSMTGLIVLQPMGWDAFGLPAENAAMDRNVSPQAWTKKNTAVMRDQMENTMLLGLDWSREISTCDPQYYRWTQWIFLQLFKAGLVYHRSAFVNWDPVDKTVLADELVDSEGISWRSGVKVERRSLRQWYFRTTAYSKSLLDGLKDIEDNQWRDVVRMQRGWLGKLDGTVMEFDVNLVASSSKVADLPDVTKERLCVFTRFPGLAVADSISFIEVHPGSVYFADQFRLVSHYSLHSLI